MSYAAQLINSSVQSSESNSTNRYQASYEFIRAECGSSNQSAIVYSYLMWIFEQENNRAFKRSDSCIAKYLKITERQVRYARTLLVKCGKVIARSVRRGLYFITEYISVCKPTNISQPSFETKLSQAPDKIVATVNLTVNEVKDNVSAFAFQEEDPPPLPPEEPLNEELVVELVEKEVQKLKADKSLSHRLLAKGGRLIEEGVAHVRQGIQSKGLDAKRAVIGLSRLLRSGRFETPACMAFQSRNNATKAKPSAPKDTYDHERAAELAYQRNCRELGRII